MRSMLRPSALRKAFLASSTRGAKSDDSSSMLRAPVSMRATSSRSPISLLIWDDWSRMIRWNWVISAGSRVSGVLQQRGGGASYGGERYP